jgi:hypothetical protein
MKVPASSGNEDRQRARQLKLRSLFALTAIVGVYLAWHRQFRNFHEYNESPQIVTILAMGLPLGLLLSGIWPKLRDSLFAVAPVVVLVLCASCTYTTYVTLMRALWANGMSHYALYGAETMWGSFLWGYGLPATLTYIAAALEITKCELEQHKYSFLACAFSILNTVAANLFVILLFTAKIRDVDAFDDWLRIVLRIVET